MANKTWVRQRLGELSARFAACPEQLADQLSLVMEGTYASVQALSVARPARRAGMLAESLLDADQVS